MTDFKVCYLCRKGADKNCELYCCDNCKNPLCQKCSGLTVTEIRVMELKNGRILKYLCKGCNINNSIQTTNLEKIIAEETKKMYEHVETAVQKVLQNELEKIEEHIGISFKLILEKITKINTDNPEGGESKKTFADVTKQGVSNEVIVIKPKEKQESKQTRTELKQIIDPKNLSIAVENMKNGRDGSIIINCNNKYTKEKITEKVNSDLNEKYTVVNTEQKNPKVKIIGVEEEYIEETNEVILEALKEQNKLDISDKTTFEVYSKYKQKNKKNSGVIILTVDPPLKNKMLELQKLNIGWRSCIVQEYFQIIRCFNCARYGHFASKCENNLTCFKCGGNHKTESCTEKSLKCINCSDANNKLNKTLNTNHPATDHKCPCYQRILNIEIRKIKTA